VANLSVGWHAVPVRHRKPDAADTPPTGDVVLDPVPLEVHGKPALFVMAQESKAPSGITLDGHDTLGQFLALQRTAVEIDHAPRHEAVPRRRRSGRVLVLRLLVAAVLLAAASVVVLYVHPA
jgi:hypothetical protein